MGLDMYMERMDRVEGYSFHELLFFREQHAINPDSVPTEVRAIEKLDVQLYGDIKMLLSEQVGYWRKEYELQGWIGEVLEIEIENCETYTISKKQLEALLHKVIKAWALADATATDDYYGKLEEIRASLESVMESTDFDNQYLLYEGSW